MNNRCTLYLVILCLMIEGCLGGQQHEPISFLDRIRSAAAPGPSTELSSIPYLDGAPFLKAEGFPHDPTFYVRKRTPELKRTHCEECHHKPIAVLIRPLGKLQSEKKSKTHWEITLDHAPSDVMTCMTCHDERKIDQLHTLGGAWVSLNHSYRVCAGCHFRQARDWAGGAHGKRLGGWVPPRVINNCPACHNPHQPRLEKRWPARSSRLPKDPK